MLKGGGFGVDFHDHEGFGTAESTKPFAIMNGEDERVEQGIHLRVHACVCVNAASCFACESRGGVMPPFNLEYPAYAEEKVTPAVPAPP
jgi:hypothetical protein